MCVPCNPPTSINHRRRSIFNQCKNPCHFPNSIVEHIKFVSGARKKTHSVDVSLIFYYECEMQHIFFLLLAPVGRLYGSHGWAKEIEYVFFFLLVLPKTSGSVQIDLTRIEQRNSTGIWLAAEHIAKSKYYFPMAGERVSRKYSQAEWNTSHFIILHPAINIARGIGSHFTYAYFAHIEAS